MLLVHKMQMCILSKRKNQWSLFHLTSPTHSLVFHFLGVFLARLQQSWWLICTQLWFIDVICFESCHSGDGDARPAVGLLEMMEITSSKTPDCVPSDLLPRCIFASAQCAQLTVNISCWRIIECLPLYRSKCNYLCCRCTSDGHGSDSLKVLTAAHSRGWESDNYNLTAFNKSEREMNLK